MTRVFLAENEFAYLSPLGHEDHQFTRYLNRTVESQGARHPLTHYERMFRGRLIGRRRVH